MLTPQQWMKMGEVQAISDIKSNLSFATTYADWLGQMTRPLTPYALAYFHTVNDCVKVKP